jgi:hypothetical protein
VTAPLSAVGPRPTRPWREAAAVVALGAVLAVAVTFPLAFKLGQMGRLDSHDGRFAIWNVAWVARALVVDPLNVFHANIFHPHERSLAFSESNLGAGALAIPAYWSTRDPLAAYNSVVVLSFLLSFVATYYLARYVTGNRRAAVVAAIAFACCPFVFARTPHIQLMMTAGLPLSLLMLHRFVDARTVGRGVALAVALVTAALLCGYFGLFAALAVGLGFGYFALTRGLWRSPQYWLAACAVVLLTALLILPFYLPYAAVRQQTGFGRELHEARAYSADWRAYLASSAWAHRWLLSLLGRWNEVLFPGFVTTALGVLGGWLAWRGRRSHSRLAEYAGFYALLGVLAVWTTFGPDAGLYTALHHTVPGFSFLRAPARAGVLVPLALAVLSAVGLELMRRARPTAAGALAMGVLSILLILELAVAPLRWRPAMTIPRAHTLLANLPRGAVAELPFYSDNLFRHTLYMFLSTYHWQPLINGYSDMIPADFVPAAVSLSEFPSPDAFKVLKDAASPARPARGTSRTAPPA